MAAEVQQGVGRAAAVLEAIASATGGPPRASDISRATGLGASTIARMLTTLEELGYVARVDNGYAIGTAVMSLSSRGLNQYPIHRESRTPVQELAQRTGFSANVAVRVGDRAVYLSHAEGERARKSHTMVGLGQPLHASALGKCLLLGLSPQERRELLGDTLAKYTVNTIGDHEALDAELERVSRDGFATEDQELALGRLCVAAPIRDATGRAVGAISLSGRLTLMREYGLERLQEDTVESADRISVALGLISAVPPTSA